LLILGLILTVATFFRSYQLLERFEFDHDGDLYSWIVKDIVVNHHPRLIGQLTSAPGIFIGGLFYYLLIPFFLLTNMDPIGVTYFAIIIGLSTIFSLYFVLSKLFKTEVGLIAASLYATLLSTINTDRWVVPTIITNLWVIWYFYSVIKIARGEYRILPLLGILIGLIWHVHIALVPALIAVPAAIYFAKKLPNAKQIAQFFITLFVANLPLLLFEARHGFGQTFSLINNFTTPQAGATGLYKLTLVLNMVIKNISILFFAPQSLSQTISIFFVLIIILLGFLLIRKEVLSYMEFLVFLIWIAGMITFFGLSASPISEYYFSNIGIIFLSLVSLLLYLVFKSSYLGKAFVVGLLIFIPIKNGYFMITEDYYHKGYAERKAVVNFIKADSENRGFPCIGISYITAAGENVGFRYFFYLSNTHLVHPSLEIPVYNIVIPDELSGAEVKQKFGHIGVIPPMKIAPTEVIQKSCQTPDTNLTDSMFGYVD
ncbi:MAG: glycosyltransferase family 39 protein, partial [bacterium]|nr:glycosyltransferase family 39 protein [bacterium]